MSGSEVCASQPAGLRSCSAVRTRGATGRALLGFLLSLAGVGRLAGQTVTLAAAADTTIKQESPNQSFGAAASLHLREGGNRVLVRFDAAAIAAAVGSGSLSSAQLQVYIGANPGNWGPTGRTVDVYRLDAAWTESGATWNCANDTNTGNRVADCAAPWAGGTAEPEATDTVVVTNASSGWLGFDVTADVLAFLAGAADDGWLLQKTDEGQAGRIDLVAREGAAGQGPRLVLVSESAAVDTVPPVLSIDAPAQPVLVNLPSPQVAVSYHDGGSGVDTGTLQVLLDGQDLTAACTVSPQAASCTAPRLAAGTHTVLAKLRDHAGNAASASRSFQLLLGPALRSLSFPVSADTYLTAGAPDREHGRAPILRVAKSGPSRALARFDAGPLLQALAGSQVLSAQLALPIAANGNNWGAQGRSVGAHRLTAAWSEGSATWDCPDDAALDNAQPDCAMPWSGGAFLAAPTGSALLTNHLAGTVSFDVTADVAAFVAGAADAGWLLAKADEGKSGRVDFAAREASSGQAAQLVVVFQVPASDTTPPALAITAPSQAVIYNSLPAVAVSYSDSDSGIDPGSLGVALDGVALAGCTAGAASASCAPGAVAPGSHTVTAHVKDLAGNQASASFGFQLVADTTLPVVTIGAPAEGSVLGTAAPTLTAAFSDAATSVDPASVQVTLDGVDVTAQSQVTAANLTFTPAAPLAEGSHAATVAVRDLAGNAGRATVHFVTDTLPPAVVIVSPQAGSILATATPTLQATFADAGTGVVAASVRLSVDGVDQTAGAQVTAAGLTFTTAGLADGAHGATIVAADGAGHQAQAAVDWSSDTGAPTLAFAAPGATAASTSSAMTVVLSYADAGSGVDTSTLRLTLDQADVSLACNADPAGTAICVLEGVATGTHALAAAVRDLAGNPAQATLTTTFTIDAQAPAVAILSPAGGSYVSTPNLTVAGTVSDAGTVTGVQVNGVAATLDGTRFQATVPLAEGPNSIVATAANAAGLQGSALAQVVLDTQAPSLLLLSPPATQTINAATVHVAGAVGDADPQVAVTVNGQAVAVTGGGFDTQVPVAEGPNTILVQAADRAGNVAAASAAITRYTLPVVAITSPADLSFLIGSTVTISGTVSDPAATVTVNGVAGTVSGGGFVAASVPLIEGGNVITATAASAAGHVGTATINVVRDLTPPHVTIDYPAAGAVIAGAAVSVAGLVNDVVAGTVNAADATVTVNGVRAAVANRSYVADGVPLTAGDNVLTAVATDASGNVGQASITVHQGPAGGPRLAIVAGDRQQAVIGRPLAQPLAVALLDATGAPVAGKTVLFMVRGGDGTLDGGRRNFAVVTDAGGQAAAHFTLGTRAGAATQVVEASAVGTPGLVDFTATALPGDASLIVVDSGNQQVGVAGQALPRPLVATVTDAGFNRRSGVAVRFKVTKGNGSLPNGQTEMVVTTDSDGRAITTLVLDPEEGIAGTSVLASIDGLAGGPVAGFVATGRTAGDPAQTSVSGVVLDNASQPLAGVTLRIEGSALTAQTNAQGTFTIAGAPVGAVKLIVDGSTAGRPGTWPDLEYVINTVAGRDNTPNMPIYLLPLDLQHGILVDETHGGTLTLPDLPGFALTIAPGTVVFPGGSRSGVVSVTVVHRDKIPMVPNFGQQPRLIVTIQPAGARFDPPARLTLPNLEGLPPGQVAEMYSFDHDLGQFVSIGPATVSDDGSVIESNPGVGILKAGWHCCGQPAASGTPEDCPDCKLCVPPDCIADPGQNFQPCNNNNKCYECQNGHCVPSSLKVQIVLPEDQPTEAEFPQSGKLSFLSTDVIVAIPKLVPVPGSAPIKWTVTPLNNHSGQADPPTGTGAVFAFQPKPPDDLPFVHGKGHRGRTDPLSYKIRADYCTSSDTHTLTQDELDAIRQEYVDHAITIPGRGDFNLPQATTHFSAAVQNTTAYNVILGQPGLMAEDVRAAYNAMISSDAQVQPLGTRGLSPAAPVVRPTATIDGFGAIAITPPCNGGPAGCDDHLDANGNIVAGPNGIAETVALRGGDHGVLMTSGWRNPELQEVVGSVVNSRHQYGNAADLVPVPFGGLRMSLLYCLLETAARPIVSVAIAEHGGTQVPCTSPTVDHVHVQVD